MQFSNYSENIRPIEECTIVQNKIFVGTIQVATLVWSCKNYRLEYADVSCVEKEDILGTPQRDLSSFLDTMLRVSAKEAKTLTLRRRVQPRPYNLVDCPTINKIEEYFKRPWILHEQILDKEFMLLAESNLRVSKEFYDCMVSSKYDRKKRGGNCLRSIEDCLKEAYKIYSLILSLGFVIEHKESRENLWTFHLEDLIVWMDMVYRDTWYGYIKNTLVYLFNKFEHLEERVFPDILKMDFHVQGLLYFHDYKQQNRLCQLTNGNKPRQISSRWTLLQGLKKGMPHCGVESIWKDCQKHVKLLTEKPDEPPMVLQQSLRSICRQIFPKKIGVEDWQTKFNQSTSVSTSACFEQKRSNGGPLSLLYPFKFNKENEDDLRSRISTYLGFEDLLGVVVTDRQTRYVHGPSFEFDINLSDNVNLIISEYLGLGISPPNWVEKPHWVKDFLDGKIDVADAFRRCYVKLIKEPLKNRPITVQSSFTNAFLQPIQKLLWKGLQKFKCFELTGREVEEKDISEIDEQDLSFFKSGDYQSATDGLNRYLTEICIEEIAKDEVTRKLMRIALLEQILDYSEAYAFTDEETKFLSKKYGSLPTDAKQKNGQLMGCVLSFPLLCIINAAVLGVTLLKYNRCKSFQDGPDLRTMKCLINGDDILFKCNHEIHEDWQSNLVHAGFKESPGKSYLSEKFGMINSTYFRIVGENRDVKRYGCVNYSWITGVQKGKDFEQDSVHDLTCLSRDFFDLKKSAEVSDLTMSKALGMIHTFRKDELKTTPLDIEQDEGGLGLPVLKSSETERNPFYQRFSTWLSRKGMSLKSKYSPGDSLLPQTMVPSKYLTINRDVNIQDTIKSLISDFKKTADYKGNRPWVPCSYEILSKRRHERSEKLHTTESFASNFPLRCLDFSSHITLSKLELTDNFLGYKTYQDWVNSPVDSLDLNLSVN